MGSVQPSTPAQSSSPKLAASSSPSSPTPVDQQQLKKLQQANERLKVEAREAVRDSRIAQRKVDAAAEEKDKAVEQALQAREAAHQKEMDSLREKYKDTVKKIEEVTDDEEDEAAEMAEDAFNMERARLESEMTALKSQAEKVQLAHHECKEQRDRALVRLSKQQEKTIRVEKSLKAAEEEHRREKASAAGKLEQARKELGTEREKRIKLREERDELSKESKETQGQLAEQLRKAREEISKLQELLATPRDGDNASSNDEVARVRRELHSALTTIQRLKPLEGELKKAQKRLEPANHQIRKLEAFNRELEKKQEVIDRDLSLKTNEIFLIQSTAEKRVEAEWTSKVAGLQDELSHIIEDLELSRGQVSQLQKTLAESQAELAIASEAVQTKNKEINELRTDNEILQDQTHSQASKLQQAVEVSGRHSALAKKLASAEDGARELEEELGDAEDKIEAQQRELEKWQNRALELETQLQDAQYPAVGSSSPHPLQTMVVNELRGHRDALQKDLEKEKHHLTEALGSLDERTQDFQSQKQALVDTCGKLEAEVKQLEIQRKTSTALISTLRTKLNESEENVGRLQKGFAALQEMMGRQIAEREQDRSSLMALQDAIVNLEGDKLILTETLATEQQKVLSIEKELVAASGVQGLSIGLVSPPESPPQSRDWKHVNGAEVDSRAINSSFLFASNSSIPTKDDLSNRTLLTMLRQLNAQVSSLQQYNAEARASNEQLVERLVELEGSQMPRSVSA